MKELRGYAEKYAKKIDEREENYIQILPQEKFHVQTTLFNGRDTFLYNSWFLNVDISDSGEGYRILVNWGTFAVYETFEQVDEVLKMIQSAIERGEKTFKLPEQEYFYQLEGLFDAQRLLKRYMLQLKKAVGLDRAVLKNNIAFEQQRIIQILAELKTA